MYSGSPKDLTIFSISSIISYIIEDVFITTFSWFAKFLIEPSTFKLKAKIIALDAFANKISELVIEPLEYLITFIATSLLESLDKEKVREAREKLNEMKEKLY